MNIFKTLFSVLKKIWEFITSPKAQRAVEYAADLVELALPIVISLSHISPKTAKLKNVVDEYNKHAVPIIQDYVEDPQSIGNALLNLATELLHRAIGKDKEVATSIMHAAIELALCIYKARK